MNQNKRTQDRACTMTLCYKLAYHIIIIPFPFRDNCKDKANEQQIIPAEILCRLLNQESKYFAIFRVIINKVDDKLLLRTCKFLRETFQHGLFALTTYSEKVERL